MISIEDYVKSNRPAAVTDMLLRQLPDAIALWREEEPLPRGGRLVKESIMVDADTGIVTIKAGAGGTTERHVFARGRKPHIRRADKGTV